MGTRSSSSGALNDPSRPARYLSLARTHLAAWGLVDEVCLALAAKRLTANVVAHASSSGSEAIEELLLVAARQWVFDFVGVRGPATSNGFWSIRARLERFPRAFLETSPPSRVILTAALEPLPILPQPAARPMPQQVIWEPVEQLSARARESLRQLRSAVLTEPRAMLRHS